MLKGASGEKMVQSYFPSSIQQGDSIRALGDSVSFGKFTTQILEWDKFSAFNQNRYLEEAQRLAKPGLVAQRKALFEAHFNKPVAEKVTGLLKGANLAAKNEIRVPRKHDNKENLGEPCMDLGSGKSRHALYINAALSCKDTLPRLVNPQATPLVESQSGEAYNNVKNDSIAVDNCSHVILEGTDGPGSNKAGDAPWDLEVNQRPVSPYDACSTNHIMVEPKPFRKFDIINGLMTVLNLPEVSGISTSFMKISQDNTAVQEPIDKFAFASTVDSKPAFTFLKPAVQSPRILRSQVLSMKENNAPENSNSSVVGMVNKKRVITKPLHLPTNQNSCLPVTKKPLNLKKLDDVKYPVNSVSTRGSKVHSDQVTAGIEGQVNTTTSMVALNTNRQSSAEPDLGPAPPRLKKKINITRTNRSIIRESVEQKVTSKHQSRAKPLNRTGSKVIQMNPVITFPQTNLKKSMPEAVNMPLGHTSNFERVKRSTMAPNCRSSRIIAMDVRVFGESSNNVQESLQKSMQASATLPVNNKGSKRAGARVNEQSNVIKTTKRQPTTVFIPFRFRSDERAAFIPFRFRSDERAAKRKQKLVDNPNIEAKKSLQNRRKVTGPRNKELHDFSNTSNNKM